MVSSCPHTTEGVKLLSETSFRKILIPSTRILPSGRSHIFPLGADLFFKTITFEVIEIGRIQVFSPLFPGSLLPQPVTLYLHCIFVMYLLVSPSRTIEEDTDAQSMPQLAPAANHSNRSVFSPCISQVSHRLINFSRKRLTRPQLHWVVPGFGIKQKYVECPCVLARTPPREKGTKECLSRTFEDTFM